MAGIDDLCARAGITTRQANYWTSRGYLRPYNAGRGTGHALDWPPAEVAVAQVMGRLVRAGVTPEAACRVARGEALGIGLTVIIYTDSGHYWRVPAEEA